MPRFPNYPADPPWNCWNWRRWNARGVRSGHHRCQGLDVFGEPIAGGIESQAGAELEAEPEADAPRRWTEREAEDRLNDPDPATVAPLVEEPTFGLADPVEVASPLGGGFDVPDIDPEPVFVFVPLPCVVPGPPEAAGPLG